MKYLVSISLLCFSSLSLSADLNHAMQDTLQYNAEYHAAQANLYASQEGTLISRAQLLPALSGSVNYSGTSNTAVVGISESSASAQLTLSQTLFDMSYWLNYENAKYNLYSNWPNCGSPFWLVSGRYRQICC